MKRIVIGIIPLLIGVLIWRIITGSFLKPLQKIYINNQAISIEVADTDDKRGKGLSNRADLANDHGILFIFPEVGFHSFWMKGMHFPLDFVWINGEKVVDLRENVPNPSDNTPDSELPMFTSKTPADKVLEVNSGTIKSLNIKIGDKLDL